MFLSFFLSANEAVGDKISLGVFSKETDWSQEEIDTKVSTYMYRK